MTKTCIICGKELPPRSKKFCQDCRYVTFVCDLCGKEITVSASKYYQLNPGRLEKEHHFCSRKCAIGFGSKIAAKLRENGVYVTCPNCGKVNRRKMNHANRRFCNRDCFFEYRHTHPELYPGHSPTGKELEKLKARTGKNNPAYGMTGEKSTHWKGGREKYRGKGWSTIRKLIKRRDENRCAICGKTEDEVTQLDVHHIFDWADTHCNHPYNLISLCINCHQGAIHGNSPAPPSRQLVALAQESTRERLAQDDLRLIVKLDLQQRCDKGLPAHIAEALGLPQSYHDDWQQIPLFESRL